MPKQSPTELPADELDVVHGGADADAQNAVMPLSTGETRQNTVSKIPGVYKVSDVTLKRGQI